MPDACRNSHRVEFAPDTCAAHNVPVRGSNHIRGREQELETVNQLLSQGDVRLCTLTGLAGVGKSSVLERVLEDAPGMPDTTRIVRVAAAAAEGLLASVAEASGVGGRIVPDVPTVAAALDAAPLIVVVDGAHVAPDAGDVIGQLLASTEAVRFVVTHRMPLGVEGERIVRIEPLPSARPGTDMTVDDPRVQLFVDAAATVGVDVADDVRTRTDVAAICDQLGGLPGAIELAALRSPAFSPWTMRTLLDDAAAHEVLSGSADSSGWMAAVSWVESLLEPDLRSLIGAMTVFAGPVPIEAVVSITGLGVTDAVDQVSQLVDMHLLDADHTGRESTYVLHPLVREHATSQWLPDDRLRAAHERWALSAVAAADRVGTTRSPVALIERDLVTVLRRCLERSDTDAAAMLAVSLGPLWLRRGVRAHEAELMVRLASSMDDQGSNPGLRALVTAWSALLVAERAMDPSDVADVVVARDEALALADHCDKSTRLAVMGICVQVARVLDDRETAVRLCEEGLSLARRQRDDHNLAQFELWSGMLAHQEQRIDDAVAMGEAAFGVARRLGDPSLIIRTAGLLATLPPDAGVSVALPAARELVELAVELDDQRSLLWLRPAAAAEALSVGDRAAAAGHVVDQMVAARSMAAWHPSSISLLLLVQVALAEGDDERAAWLHGVVAGHLDILRPGLPPHMVKSYNRAIESLRGRLSTDRFDTLAAQGSLLPIEEAHAEASTYARSITERLSAPVDDNANAEPQLTNRESEVLARLVAGDSNKDVARRLGITPKTVMHHTSSIYRKLGVRGRTEAVAWALRGPDHPAA